MENRHFDVIIIGAGMAGLTCAARLARAGKRVLLLEQHTRVGGYCANFKRKGFEFDASIHLILGCEPGGILHNILVDCGAENHVGFIRLDPMYKSVLPDRSLKIPSTVPAYKELLYREFPTERKGIDGFFDGMERIYDFLTPFSDKRTPLVRKALLPMTKARNLAFIARNSRATLGQYLDRHFTDRKIREVVSQLWGFLGVPPDRLSLLFFAMMLMGYLKEGTYYIKGGSQRLSDGLAGAFKENGGILLTAADVKKITLSQNRARGVEVFLRRKKSLETFTADNVVSCADPTHTLFDLVGREYLPAGYAAKIEKMVPSMSGFCVYLGVEMDLPQEFADDFDLFINYTWDSEKAFEKVKRFGGFDSLAISIYSNVEPSFSPEPGKKHVIALTVLLDLAEERMKELWGVTDVDKRGPEYKKIKEAMADELIGLAEKTIPGLTDAIRVKSIATPVTMKRYTRNLNGAMVGWENNLSQTIFNRMQQRTPVENLYLASAWTFPGGGVNGATMGGFAAAERLLKGRKLPVLTKLGPLDAFLDMASGAF